MSLDEIVDLIKLRLGNRFVEVEIADDDIKLLFKSAKIKLASITNYDICYKNVQAMDVQPFDAEVVIRVYNNNLLASTTNDATDLFSFYIISNRDMFTTGIRNSLVYQAYGALSDTAIQKGFKFADGKLYLYNHTGTVTVEFIPKVTEETILDDRKLDWCIRYTLVLCKEVLGRIRSKHRSGSMPFELDGEILLGEVEQEKQNLIDELNGDGLFFVDTD